MDDPNQFVYWEATRGTGIRNHVFPDSPSNLLIYTRPCPMKDLSLRYKLATMEDKRFYYCNVKTLNLIPSVLASQRALEKGCDETVFHRGDLVTECAHSNVSIIKDGKFITHQLDCLVLPGITRKHLIEICHEKGIPVEERDYTLEELKNADENNSFVLGRLFVCLHASLTVSPSAAKLPKSSKLFRTHTSNVFMTNAVNKTDNTHLQYGCFA